MKLTFHFNILKLVNKYGFFCNNKSHFHYSQNKLFQNSFYNSENNFLKTINSIVYLKEFICFSAYKTEFSLHLLAVSVGVW